MGMDPYDGLNSPFLRRLGGNSKYLRIILTHLVKDSPFNLRPTLGIDPERNPKGIALFSLSYNNIYRTTHNKDYDHRARSLVEWLLEHRVDKEEYTYWGYNFPWQSGRSFLPRYGPCSVVTYFVTEAVRQIHHDHQLLERVATFYLEHLNRLVDDEDQLCLSYTPFESEKIVNSNALIAHQLASIGFTTQKPMYVDEAKRMVNWVISQQDTDGGWNYSPTSHLKKDNFHNGYVIWALMRYREVTRDDHVTEPIRAALEFYLSLFDDDGMPRFSHEKAYPVDIHNCSQGIITLGDAQQSGLYRNDLYKKILKWTLDNMWDEREHYFYHRKHRWRTDRTPYMRWSQGWMAYALSEVLRGD